MTGNRHGNRHPARLKPRARHVWIVRWTSASGTTKGRLFLVRAAAERFYARTNPWRRAELFSTPAEWGAQTPRGFEPLPPFFTHDSTDTHPQTETTPMPAPRTFHGWLRTQADRSDAVGDAARHLLDDSCAPLASARVIRRHLVEHHADAPIALLALDCARDEYETE